MVLYLAHAMIETILHLFLFFCTQDKHMHAHTWTHTLTHTKVRAAELMLEELKSQGQ